MNVSTRVMYPNILPPRCTADFFMWTVLVLAVTKSLCSRKYGMPVGLFHIQCTLSAYLSLLALPTAMITIPTAISDRVFLKKALQAADQYTEA